MRILTVLVALALLLSACSSEVLLPTPTPTAWEGTLQLLENVTPPAGTPAVSFTASLTPSPTASLSPTATPVPVTYKVTKNDDMFGIAFRFGISPQMLMTANPSVNPRTMGVGTVLIIPITPVPDGQSGVKASTPSPKPTATPGLVSIPHAPDCYPAGDGGAWCFWLIQSGPDQGVESVTGTISLVQPGASAQEQPASLPLDIIGPGQALPLAAYFPSPIPSTLIATAKLTLVLPLPKGDGRYLPIEVMDVVVSLDPGSGGAVIKGVVSLEAGSKTANHVRLAATGYDQTGAVVSLRVWDASDPLSGGATLPFQIQLDTLGQAINKVTLQAEARP